MVDHPFDVALSPRLASTPGATTELLWTISEGGRRIDCQLLCCGKCGVEAQFLEDGKFFRSRRFSTQALAVEWAILEKQEWRKAMSIPKSAA
jgi:hypothetical protein